MRLLLATRPMFLTASVLPVLVGTAWGYRMAGELDLTALLLAIATLVLVHASANVLNDVFDDIGGTDAVNESRIFPYTGGSRFIQDALLSRRQMAIWGVILLLLGVGFGAALVAQKGVVFLLFGLVGITLALLYSMPPVQLNARGLGELAVAAAFGVLPVTGAAWLQSGLSIFGALVLSLPVACWVMAILLANEVPDREADRSTGKHTLVVRLGVVRSRGLYFIIQALSLLFMALAVSLGMLKSWALLLPALLLPVAAYAALGLSAGPERLKRSIELTLTIHMIGGLWLAVWALVPA
ncbi:prenyltransferase [Marinobacterium aestuariivivens]|uniref:Prenyltransferase n=1 Tax=Marinobacterium aestuariivivens TaxID=1698799 RepID=A0ABW2A6P5_9GAMM